MKRINILIFVVLSLATGFFFSLDIFIYGKTAPKKKLPDNDECLMCHDDPTITMEKGGKVKSLEVKKFTLAKSVHAYLKCDECHIGFDPSAIPHKDKIEPINCQSCHQDAYQKHKFHPGMKFAGINSTKPEYNCKGCHGTHNITSPKNPNSALHFTNSTNFCGNCHKDEKTAHLKSVHSFEYEKNNPNAPTCIYCHKEPITNGFNLEKVQLKLNQEKLCLNCHLKGTQTEFSKSLVNYEESTHGRALQKGNKSAAVCVDCHGAHELLKASDPRSKINRFEIPNVCGKCHISIANEYKASIHGQSLLKGNMDSPGCTYCHGEHGIAPVPEVTQRIITAHNMNFNTVVSTRMLYCVECHTNDTLMKKYNISTVAKAHEWLPNVARHYQTVRCVDCHSSYEPPNLSHNILPPDRTIKKCEECHSKNSILMTKLYKHEKEKSREKYGFINGTILSDAYVVGTTRNVILDVLSIAIFGVAIFGIFIHAFMRWYFRRSPHIEDEKEHSDDKEHEE
ncbi:MAG: hypothetical protein N2319_13575 [Candidatus Kapabacteria bacterium]|nr:hypothetical protein [Candidatus Kapabacteria bacterium]